MGTITTGTGIASGIDIQGLINQLLAIDARPRDLLARRIANIDAQRTALLDVSARVSSLLSRVNSLALRSTFDGVAVSSSKPETLTATASGALQPGSYSFMVRALASTQQAISQGFRSTGAAVGPGTLTIESARARVDRQTRLDELNGYAGVQRGSFVLVDGANTTRTVSIADARSVQDVVERINSAGLNIRASLHGDALLLTETNGGQIQVREVNGGRTASDLGFRVGNTAATGQLTGSKLIYLSNATPSAALNDGLGIRVHGGGDFRIYGGDTTGQNFDFNVDFSSNLSTLTRVERLNHGGGANLGTIRITKTDRTFVDVNLAGLKTIGEIKSAVESAVPGVLLTPNSGRLSLSYANSASGQLTVEDISGTAARDLGIAGTSDTGKISGREILRVDSMADVLAAINYANGNDGSITASLSGDRVVINGAADFRIDVLNSSRALGDLGLTSGAYDNANPASGKRILGGIDTVLLQTLQGGAGVGTGVIRIAANGATADVDLSNATTLRDVLDAINAAAQSANLGITAGYDANGTRLLLSDQRGGGISVSDLSGSFAVKLGLAGSGAALRSDNLQRQYISENTRLADLNAGRGITLGKLKLTNSRGATTSIDLAAGSPTTLGQIIERINAANAGVRASINSTGDGLLLTDTSGGTEKLRVAEDGGVVARDLNLLGESGNGLLDGSYELNLTLAATDTLDDLVRKINEKTSLASASIVNDGTPIAPFRLNLTSRASGLAGEIILDGAAAGIDFTTIAQARDAEVLIGNPSGGLLVSGSTNTFTDIVPGLTINLQNVDNVATTISVSRNYDGIVEVLEGFVSAYNGIVDRIDDVDSYNPDTQQAGILLGDTTVRNIESRLARLLGAVGTAGGAIRRLSQLGITLRNGEASFDQAKFRAAYDANPQAIAEFFANDDAGLAKTMQTELKKITDADGLVDRRGDALENQKTQLSGRIDSLNELLERKRERLSRQFLAMERALAGLQAQQSALGTLTSAANSGGGGGLAGIGRR